MSAADDGATDDLRALANAPLRRQAAALERIIRTDPDLMAILVLIRDLRLPDGWLLAGCLYQTVWNVMENRPRGHGVKDYDIGYFDGSDLSYEAEDAEIARVVARAPSGLDLELRNQARVHLWFKEKFGFAVSPLTCTLESLARYASVTHAVAARLADNGEIEIAAPFGMRDLFAMHLRPNRALPNGPSHDAKAKRCQSLWPVTVEWW
ncbi:MAG: hypothetical protein BGP06_13010 [Rhizobiales bacterium 65-9]|nr:nucleotidyltransferase family protein [Hyphomicrobiales bacterium]OJY38943.1 MAG: hypothetical protein BGP06_13010 [Rhizobiales bacterium 65-9]